MSAKIKKLNECLKTLESASEVDGCALVSARGQLMAAALHKGVDEKAVSAMAAATMAIGIRVSAELSAGDPRLVMIEGLQDTIIIRPVSRVVLIGIAQSASDLGLIGFEMEQTAQKINATFQPSR